MSGSLRALQRALGANVLHDDPAVLSAVHGSPGADAATRLDVYARAYRLRLLEVLSDHYPGLKGRLGDERFDRLGRAFIAAHPSQVYNIRWYGAALAAFIAQDPAWSDDPALAELATFEWAMTVAFDAVDEEVITTAHFAGVAAQDWPALRFELVRALQRVPLAYAVASMRAAMDRGEAAPDCALLPTPGTWAIWRDGGSVMHRRLEPDEAEGLAAVADGACFAELCDLLVEHLPEAEVPMRAASLLRRWVEAGWLRSANSGAGQA